MQWLLQEFEDTQKLADALDRLGISYSWHKVVPFIGDLTPEPVVTNPDNVVLFGSYTLWRYAANRGLKPGVFKLRPFVNETEWHPYLLNGPDSLFLHLKDIPTNLPNDGRSWFLRPVDDSKEVPGTVKTTQEIIALAQNVLGLGEDEIPKGSLRHDTLLMLSQPIRILKEWRLWVVDGKVVTYSLYKEGTRVVYRPGIDEDALAFAQRLVDLNPDYSPAFVIDICRTTDGLKMLETNCINAAGFYAADLLRLVDAIETMGDRSSA
ncbi:MULTISPECIES: ATP-grasp domain-containing protein [unclassified Ruegeria]|uniref:ATP-grasp domain-containing protein n=1 Tax=unclassified Ruegeria TaxID=2625375 RepID=UPI001ADAEB3F|nr:MULTISPECIES: ATP-grasp domain-containing protein [unclassified Ruegeria]MBO9411972.1 ATP-grasp domain-containing protein [Ruegeria sp. R8_1]MBO9417081.1 ATP-grasp domain-containing protein [Ruegeria sp. R8_2]